MHAGRSVDTYMNDVEWVNPLHAHVSQGVLRLSGGLIHSDMFGVNPSGSTPVWSDLRY